MDGNRFDGMARALAEARTRRGVVAGLLGGAAAVAAAALGRGPAAAAPKGGPGDPCKVGCAGFNRQAKTACEKACKQCGGDLNRVCTAFGPFGPTAFACCGAGTACEFETGACVEVATCPETGEPAENCALGITSDCADGACAQVVNVDGGCACVERQCSFEACATGSDCASGLCVDIPGCCGEPTPFCGIPCGGTGGGGGNTTGATAAGWSH
jgi:hypothetical protein